MTVNKQTSHYDGRKFEYSRKVLLATFFTSSFFAIWIFGNSDFFSEFEQSTQYNVAGGGDDKNFELERITDFKTGEEIELDKPGQPDGYIQEFIKRANSNSFTRNLLFIILAYIVFVFINFIYSLIIQWYKTKKIREEALKMSKLSKNEKEAKKIAQDEKINKNEAGREFENFFEGNWSNILFF